MKIALTSMIATGLVVLAVSVLPTAAFAKDPDAKNEALVARVTALEAQVEALSAFVEALEPFIGVNPHPMNGLAGPHIIFSGVNVHVRSGSGATNDGWSDPWQPPAGTLSGLGNLVVGYNEVGPPTDPEDYRHGSHNLVIGPYHTYWSFGSLIAGVDNRALGNHSSVSGGHHNDAQGYGSSVSGGYNNEAGGNGSSVSGGHSNYAMKDSASISGGANNFARGHWSSISGGENNVAAANGSSVSGGHSNYVNGQWSSICGGNNNSAYGEHSTVSGQCGYTATATCEWQPQSNP